MLPNETPTVEAYGKRWVVFNRVSEDANGMFAMAVEAAEDGAHLPGDVKLIYVHRKGR